MSFGSQVKEELSKINNLAKKDQVKMELCGYLISSNTSIIGKKIKFSTESEYNINRFAKLLKNCGIDNYTINIKGKKFFIEFKIPEKNAIFEIDENSCKINKYESTEFGDKALVRGVFLGGGYVNNPEKKYHMTINLSTEQNLDFICNILKKYTIFAKKLESDSMHTLYLKEGEEISKLLAFVGANTSVLKFEETRVIRDTSNNLNRIVNCETANLTKTIQAGKKQIDDIKYIKAKRKFSELPENLQIIANLRLKYPEASLTELVKIMDNSISRSGISHRLSAISKFADEIRSR
ncbi:MAG: DNA-binding protein WhiA [Clostridia bacterium]|nr:DNA-binding protein WhiA [Clostridia bacterium]